MISIVVAVVIAQLCLRIEEFLAMTHYINQCFEQIFTYLFTYLCNSQ